MRLFFLLACFAATARAEEPSCDPGAAIHEVSYFDLLDRKVAAYVAEDGALFCANATRVRLAEDRGILRRAGRAPSPAELDASLAEAIPATDPWLHGLIPSLEAKQVALDGALRLLPIAKNARARSVREWLANPAGQDIDALHRAWKKDGRASYTFGQLKTLAAAAPAAPGGMAARAGACALYGSARPLECEHALASLVKEVSPVHPADAGFSYSLLPEMELLLRDPKLKEGLRLAALKLLDRTRSPPDAKADLFGDVKNSFIASGLADKDADEAAWRTMGVIATSGANFVLRMRKLDLPADQLQAAVSLSTIAGALPLLDGQYSGSGHLYSYPPSVHTSCDTGKSYHFWMSAFLAHRGVQAGNSARAAAEAAYVSDVGYHILDDDFRPLVAGSQTFSPGLNILRADFSYTAAGAEFGAGRTGTVSIDEGIRHAVATAPVVAAEGTWMREVKRNLPAEAEVLRFNSMVNPRGILDFYR